MPGLQMQYGRIGHGSPGMRRRGTTSEVDTKSAPYERIVVKKRMLCQYWEVDAQRRMRQRECDCCLIRVFSVPLMLASSSVALFRVLKLDKGAISRRAPIPSPASNVKTIFQMSSRSLTMVWDKMTETNGRSVEEKREEKSEKGK